MKITNENGTITTLTKSNHCPSCNKHLDAASGLTDSDISPKEGDFSICAYCGAVLRFRQELTVELATEEDLDEIDDEGLMSLAIMQSTILNRNHILNSL